MYMPTLTHTHCLHYNISDGIDGSASSYTITYTDSTTGVACVSATVPAATCVNSTCEHKLQLPSSSCSDLSKILVQVSGTNRLGSDPSLSIRYK